ncbi:MAG: hypothetical protein AAGA86_03960, partial [Bacteroidota bacterium]
MLTIYILISNTKKSKGDLLLATIIGTFTVQILGLFLANRGIARDFLQSINCAYGFLYGPLLLFYIRCITQRQFVFSKRNLLHFFPFLVMGIGIWITRGGICISETYIAYVIHVLFYILLCFVQVKRYKQVMKTNYSQLDWLNVGWLHGVFVVFCLIVLTDIAQFLAFFLGLDTYYLENALFLLMLATINVLYFYGFTSSRKPF